MISYEQWRKARAEALRTLDLKWARSNIGSSSPYSLRVPDDVLLIAMHKTRYDCTDIEDALRLESGEWLRANGYSAQGGRPLEAPGKLPPGR